MTTIVRTRPRTSALAAFDALLSVYGETQFEAGEWDRNEHDEPFSTVHARAQKAERLLRAHVASLVALLPGLLCVNHAGRPRARWDAVGCYGTPEEHAYCQKARAELAWEGTTP